MPLAEEDVLRCEQCGAPLATATAPGTISSCLNCLLLGGLDETESINRRFQHYEVSVSSDGVTPWELGRGAMGTTYHAIDTNLGSPVALKVIGVRYSADPVARERFRREAQAAAQLRHPNVATVFHFGETPAGQCFYAMELGGRRNAGGPCASGRTVANVGYAGHRRTDCAGLGRRRKTRVGPSRSETKQHHASLG